MSLRGRPYALERPRRLAERRQANARKRETLGRGLERLLAGTSGTATPLRSCRCGWAERLVLHAHDAGEARRPMLAAHCTDCRKIVSLIWFATVDERDAVYERIREKDERAAEKDGAAE